MIDDDLPQPEPRGDEDPIVSDAIASAAGLSARELEALRSADSYRRTLATGAALFGAALVLAACGYAAWSLVDAETHGENNLGLLMAARALIVGIGVTVGYAVMRLAEKLSRPLATERWRSHHGSDIGVLRAAVEIIEPLIDKLAKPIAKLLGKK